MDSIREGQLIESLKDAYASMYEAKYHIKQADDQINRLQSRGPMTKKQAGRAKAWQRLKDHESKIPENKDEQRAMAKERRKQPKKSPEEKLKDQKPGKEAKRVGGIAKRLKKDYGSTNAAAKDPKVKKKVDGVYKDMLRSNQIDSGKQDKEAGGTIASRESNDAKKSGERAPNLKKLRSDMKLKERCEAVVGKYIDPTQWLSKKYK